jgi:hypothetical protein
MSHRIVVLLAVVMAAAAGCSDGDGSGSADPTGDGSTATSDASGDPASDDEDADEPRTCRRDRLDDDPVVALTDDDVSVLAGRVGSSTHACAPVVVTAASDDPWAAAIAAPVARSVDGPLLLATAVDDAQLTSALSDLDTEELLTVGLSSATEGDAAPESVAITELTAAEEPDDAEGEGATDQRLRHVRWAVSVADHLETSSFLAVDDTDEEARAAALARLRPDVAMLPLPADGPGAAAEELPDAARVEVLSAIDGEAERITEALVEAGIDAQPHPDNASLWPESTGSSTTWLVDPASGVTTAVGAVAAAGRDEALLPIDATDPRSGRERTMRIRDEDADRHVLLGDLAEDTGWQLETVLEGEALPSGGFRLFEDERMVALYGSVETGALGALGEQGLDATIDRVRSVAEPYGADGARVLPAFELITTIASASAEPTGDYSRRTPIETLRPWVDRAADEGLYVILDLQPGRTDFLTQAQEYEELLLEPHVGLALDPEWRLEPDEVHLRQIGSVEAAEVQQVTDWLAELTRDNLLPEKLLVLHQFRFSMLPDRDTIEAPAELAMVVHMDGQGPIGTKYDTYDAITSGSEDQWLWGWKNFYDEDTPTPTPEQVLDLDPLPVFVSYQ